MLHSVELKANRSAEAALVTVSGSTATAGAAMTGLSRRTRVGSLTRPNTTNHT